MNNILAWNADQSRALKDEELDTVSSGWFCCFAGFISQTRSSSQGQNDPAQMFQQIMQQLTQG
jgi:hypothetical protein